MKRIVLTLFLIIKIISSSAQIHWTNIASLTITGQTLQKVGNIQTAWNAGAISQQSFYPDGWVEFSNTSVNPSTINYAIYGFIDGYLQVFQNGVRVLGIGKGQSIHVQYTATDILRVERKNVVVYYKKNGTVFYTSTIPSSQPLHIDCSFYQANSAITVTNYRFGLVWIGAQSEEWNDPANWNLNRVPTSGDQVTINTCSTCSRLSNTANVGALQLNNGSILNLDNNILTVGTVTIINGGQVQSNQGKLKSADFVEIKNTIFKGTIALEKTGGDENNSYGGNTFSAELKIVNSSNNAWKVSTQADNVVKNF